MTTGSKEFNVQIQVNKQTTISTLKGVAPRSVSHILIPIDAKWTAAEVRAKLKAASML
ncbi:hypothetical protein MMC07_008731 [Pseudocyphellaria aurata]|nr:hypothetical protein [Pseudocyphellaria aurata]